jgi:uncharacterized protein YbjT (DUF2867 family)
MASTSPSSKILVTGATGKQGGAVIDALLSSNPTPAFQIIAVTRNTNSAKAKALATKPNVTVVEGNLNDCDAIFSKVGQVWGVFSVQVVGKEEAQGKALVNAAIANGVKHFVYTSVDRGGPVKSDSNPTDISLFISKYNIEKHLMEKASTSPQGMGWTILRPTTFFENLTPDFVGKIVAAIWQSIGNKKLQFISTEDIGYFASQAFQKPDEYRGQAISLAGDELSFSEANEIFKAEIGRDMPITFTCVVSALRWSIKDIGRICSWLSNEGHEVDIPSLKMQYPPLKDFRTWLKESSRFKPSV